MTLGNGSDRVPPEVWSKASEDDDTEDGKTPRSCGTHCHQVGRIDTLFELTEKRWVVEDKRHHDILVKLSEVSTAVQGLQSQLVRVATAGTEMAAAAVVEQTQRVRALSVHELDSEAPPPAPATRRRKGALPSWALRLLAGLGSLIGTAWAAYQLARK